MGVKRIGSMIDILILSPHNKTQLIGNFSNDEGDSLRKHPFLLALGTLSGEERGETDVFAGYEGDDNVNFKKAV